MSDVIGVPDFTKITRGGRPGRPAVSRYQFEQLEARVAELEKIISDPKPRPRGRPRREVTLSDQSADLELGST